MSNPGIKTIFKSCEILCFYPGPDGLHQLPILADLLTTFKVRKSVFISIAASVEEFITGVWTSIVKEPKSLRNYFLFLLSSSLLNMQEILIKTPFLFERARANLWQEGTKGRSSSVSIFFLICRFLNNKPSCILNCYLFVHFSSHILIHNAQIEYLSSEPMPKRGSQTVFS